VKPKLGYVLVGVLPDWSNKLPPVALVLQDGRVPYWSVEARPALFKTRKAAVERLEQIKTWYGDSAVLSVEPMTLRSWDRLRIQDLLFDPRS
jgi:hypothetical protein